MWNYNPRRWQSPDDAAKAAASSVTFDRDTIPDFLRQNPTQRSPGLGWWPPNLRLQRSDLCSSCRAINFEAAFTTPRIGSRLVDEQPKWPYVYERRAQSPNEDEGDSDCQFCRYLANAVNTRSENGDYTLVFHNERESYHDLDTVLIKVFPFIGNVSGLSATSEQERRHSNTIICHRNRPVRKAGRPQVVSSVYDVLLAQSWLETCRQRHTKECGLEDHVEIPETRLIDCFTRTLVSTGSITDPRPCFVALSYVWGKPTSKPQETEEPQTRADSLPGNLPLTIEDSITVTKALGFQYLWVDQYCINQQDQADKARQISQMDLIYKSADLTIIAATGDSCQSGLRGVSSWCRDILDPFVLDDVFTFGVRPKADFYNPCFKNGRWHTRGWTFQEALLSRRLLVFSDTAMHYECNGHGSEAWQSELSGGVEDPHYDVDRAYSTYDRFPSVIGPNSVVNTHVFDPEIPHRRFVGSLFTYMRLAKEYTTRNLTETSDGLNAFRGAANALQNLRPPVFNVKGIPFVVSKITDSLALNSFLRGLEWLPGSGRKAPLLEFPSWSWANVMVWEVTWTWDYDYAEGYQKILTDAIYCAQDIQIEFDLGGNKELHAFAEFAKACRKSTPPPNQFQGNPIALCFKSRILKSSFASKDHVCDYETIEETGNVYSDLGHDVLEISVHVDVASTQQQLEGNESGSADQLHASTTICSSDTDGEWLYTAMESGKYGLVLLRFNDWDASVLLVEWVAGKQVGHQKTARRVGICLFEHPSAKEGDHNNPFLRCFSSDIDLRLV